MAFLNKKTISIPSAINKAFRNLGLDKFFRNWSISNNNCQRFTHDSTSIKV